MCLEVTNNQPYLFFQTLYKMFTLGSRLAQFHIASGTTASEDTKEENPQPTQTFNEFLQYVR